MSTERPDEPTQQPDADETSFTDDESAGDQPASGEGTGDPGADDRPIVIGGGQS